MLLAIPQGIGSSWRECDTQAIARNFLGEGWNPLRPLVDWRGDTNGARQVSSRMVDMTKGLERDAQVESLVRGRAHELGVKPELGLDLARDLAASVSMERSRSIGMGL